MERSFGTAQDRLVKEMRLAGVKTIAQANALLDGGEVVVEVRLDGTMAIRFKESYLKYHESAPGQSALGGSAPQTPEV